MRPPPDRSAARTSADEAPTEGGPLWGLTLVLAEIAERVERASVEPAAGDGGEEAAA